MKKVFRIVSLSIASLALCASSIISPVHASETRLVSSDKSFSQKAVNFVSNHKGKIILGAVSAASIAALCTICTGFEGLNVERYINSQRNLPISADVWFERLGGTQEDIDKYNDIVKSDEYRRRYPNGIRDQIQGDVERTFRCGTDEQSGEILDKKFPDLQEKATEILRVWELKSADKEYTQGMDMYVKLILIKFAKNYDGNSEEINAKANYIFTKMMEVIYFYYINPMLCLESRDECFVSRMKSGLSYQEKCDFDKLKVLNDKGYIPITTFMDQAFMQCAIYLYGYDESAKIWDEIILDDIITTKRGFNFNNFMRVMDVIIGKKIVQIFRDNRKNLTSSVDESKILKNISGLYKIR